MESMDAKFVRNCFLSATAAIQAKEDIINDLNVFPVPDGDTGTNMTMTITTVANDLVALPEDATMSEVAKTISSGSLRGARGNSGVILSQLFRGFTKVIRDREYIDVPVVARAMDKAVDSAFKAVMKPKEGTILTVAKCGAEVALEHSASYTDLAEFVEFVLEHMNKALDHTPEQLPVLKEAGVVDSGGKGLVTIIEGALAALKGEAMEFVPGSGSNAAHSGRVVTGGSGMTGISTGDIKFGYCTEFIVKLEGKKFTEQDEKNFKSYLLSIGDSLVCVADEDYVKIHVHTNDPGLAIQKGLTYGQLTRMKIDNMREEHTERVFHFSKENKGDGKITPSKYVEAELVNIEEVEEEIPLTKDVGFISVSAGSGLEELFHELGVDEIVCGGQTMNPSTEDILATVKKVPAKNVFVFPNNSNIILAAEQAKKLSLRQKVIVIPTKSIPEGVIAMSSYLEGSEVEEIKEEMQEAISHVRCGQITNSVRDTTIDGKTIEAGDFMGLSEKTIEVVGKELTDTTVDLVEHLIDEESEIATLYVGEEASEEEAEEVVQRVKERHPELEVEVELGGQPVYHYFISVE